MKDMIGFEVTLPAKEDIPAQIFEFQAYIDSTHKVMIDIPSLSENNIDLLTLADLECILDKAKRVSEHFSKLN